MLPRGSRRPEKYLILQPWAHSNHSQKFSWDTGTLQEPMKERIWKIRSRMWPHFYLLMPGETQYTFFLESCSCGVDSRGRMWWLERQGRSPHVPLPLEYSLPAALWLPRQPFTLLLQHESQNQLHPEWQQTPHSKDTVPQRSPSHEMLAQLWGFPPAICTSHHLIIIIT